MSLMSIWWSLPTLLATEIPEGQKIMFISRPTSLFVDRSTWEMATSHHIDIHATWFYPWDLEFGVVVFMTCKTAIFDLSSTVATWFLSISWQTGSCMSKGCCQIISMIKAVCSYSDSLPGWQIKYGSLVFHSMVNLIR
jgi:hypothetical protein